MAITNYSKRKNKPLRRTLAMIGAAILIAIVAAGIFVYSGVYNVAATRQHAAPIFYLLSAAMRQSVRLRAAHIEVPDLSAAASADSGFRFYRAHCVQCHGAPGVAPDVEALGMLPAPPNLVDVARNWSAAEIFWVISNGIKMTAMPAWQYRFSDTQMWNIVAFLQRLPAYSPADYQSMALAHRATADKLSDTDVSSRSDRAPDAAAGKHAIDQYWCATCHSIPGIVGADKAVGPPLDGIARRKYIAGILANTPDNMARWIQHPQQVNPASAMPELGVADADARDIAAYLYTLNGTSDR